MQIDWVHFTPLTSIIGGILIGLAAALLFLVNGRILGVSGILGGLVAPNANDTRWRVWFVIGLLVPPVLLGFTGAIKAPLISNNYWLLIVAGLLVGFGSRLGSGCTSGHGICGLARLSPRSMVATLTFMIAGFATTYAARHLF